MGRFKKDPPQFAAQAYTGVQVMVEALRKVEKETKKKITRMELGEVRERLNRAVRTGSYKTPLGEIALNREQPLLLRPQGLFGARPISKV